MYKTYSLFVIDFSTKNLSKTSGLAYKNDNERFESLSIQVWTLTPSNCFQLLNPFFRCAKVEENFLTTKHFPKFIFSFFSLEHFQVKAFCKGKASFCKLQDFEKLFFRSLLLSVQKHIFIENKTLFV